LNAGIQSLPQHIVEDKGIASALGRTRYIDLLWSEKRWVAAGDGEEARASANIVH